MKYIKSSKKLIFMLTTVLLVSLCGCAKTPKEVEEEPVSAPKIISIQNDAGDYAKPQEEVVEEIIEEEPVEEFIYDDENKTYSKEAANPDEVVLRFVGDICFYDDFSLMSTYRSRGSDINNCIDASLLESMRSADIFMANNEFPYSDRGAPLQNKKYTFRSKPSNVSILNDMGADIVSLANNHAYDWGPDALVDSFSILKDAKVPYVGAGMNIAEAMHPVYFKINGMTISYVSATQIERTGSPDTKEATEETPGVLRTLDSTKACAAIAEANANSDFVIMYVHWGSENTDLVDSSQKDLAKKYVESGADLIIGDHSHCLQGIDYIGNVPVFYSLGNYWFNSKTVDTGIAEIILNSGAGEGEYIKSVKFIPAIQRGCRTNEVSQEEATRIFDYLQGISDYAEVDLSTGVITRSDTNHNRQGGMNTSPTKKTEPETINIDGIIYGKNENGELYVIGPAEPAAE